MDPTQFLKMVNGLKGQGDGFRRDWGLDLGDAFVWTDGSTPTTTLTTNPGYALAETNERVLQWNANIVVAAGFSFYVPGDYDQSKDELRLLIDAQCADNNTLTLDAYKKTMGSSLSSDLGPISLTAYSAGLSPLSSAQAPAANLSATSQRLQFDISGKGIKAGDILTLKITPGAHAANAVQIFGLFVRFRSDFALYTESER
jgi:hypothetical protein